MARYPIVLILSLSTLAASSGSSVTQTADEVIEKHIAALGGRAALGKLTSRRATGKVTITTQAGDISGPIEISSKAPNKTRAFMKIDMSPIGLTETMTLEQKFDGTTGWLLNSLQGDTPITGNQLDNMKNSTFPSPLLNYKAAGITVELLPRATVAGKEMILLRVAPKTGSVVTMYLDPATFLVMRTTSKVNTADVGELDQLSEASDYRDVSGIKVPFVVVNSNSLQKIVISLDKVEHNVTIDDAIFSAKRPS